MYIHICIYIYIYTFIHIYIYACMYVCMYVNGLLHGFLNPKTLKARGLNPNSIIPKTPGTSFMEKLGQLG